ncbi:MAG: ATP-binding protein, partial [Dehalococcoidia bacterium]
MAGYAGRTPLVGRQRERALLWERLRAAGRGEGGVTVVAGEPGIGKTRLLEEVAAQAKAAGWTVIGGRAYETEGLPPYLPFVEALTAWAGACSDEELAAGLGGAASEVALLLPEVGAR